MSLPIVTRVAPGLAAVVVAGLTRLGQNVAEEGMIVASNAASSAASHAAGMVVESASGYAHQLVRSAADNAYQMVTASSPSSGGGMVIERGNSAMTPYKRTNPFVGNNTPVKKKKPGGKRLRGSYSGWHDPHEQLKRRIAKRVNRWRSGTQRARKRKINAHKRR